MNVLGSPTKSFRAAFLQVVESPYIEAAQAYGASNWRIITRYLIPRVMPVVIPQVVSIIPSFIFLEATLGLFNIKMIWKLINYCLKVFRLKRYLMQPLFCRKLLVGVDIEVAPTNFGWNMSQQRHALDSGQAWRYYGTVQLFPAALTSRGAMKWAI